jgi:hypothetical protein
MAGMFDDLIPAQPARSGGGMFDDLIPQTGAKIKGVPPVAPKNMDAWFASQIGQPAQPAPGEGNFPDQPQALQPPERSIFAPELPHRGYAAQIREMAQRGPSKPAPITNDELVKEYGEEGLGFYKGAVKAPDNLTLALDTGYKRMGVNLDELDKSLGMLPIAERIKAHQDFIAAQEAKGMRPGAMGQAAGELATTMPMVAATGAGPALGAMFGPVAEGAMYGALTTDAKDVQGVGRDALIGAVGGKLGDVGLKSAGAVVAPKYSTNVQKLLDEGVKLTPGMIGGKYAKYIEDLATSVPVTGFAIKDAQRRALESYNRAAVNRTLTPIGAKLPDRVPTGHEAVGFAQDTLDDAYKALLPNLTVAKDTLLLNGANTIKAQVTHLPPDRVRQITTIIDDNLAKFSPAGTMDGPTMKKIDSELGRLVRNYRGSAIGDEREVGAALSDFKRQLFLATERANPTYAPQLKNIDRGYANLVRIERAAKGAKDGVFTPGQLQTATRVEDSSLRQRASSRGRALMQDLATAGRDILPSTVPDSGTALREAVLRGGQWAAAGGVGAFSPATVAGPIAGYAAYTRPGQYALRTLLAARPQGAQGVRKALASYKPAAVAEGALGAADSFRSPPP